MAYWAVVLPEERYQAERLFQHETVELSGLVGPATGDEALLVADDQVVAIAKVRTEKPLVLAYARRAFDHPQPAEGLALDGALTRLEPAAYLSVADRIGPAPDVSTWLVSLDLPIEASSPAEAVRQFWTYVTELGPGELPAFVWPAGDELAMQAYLLGAETTLDPEDDE
jgi:hypothetical protein